MIGQGMEKYLTITLGKHIVFKDSLQFMGASLQTLGSNLLKAGFAKFAHLKKEWANTPDDQLRLLVRKDVYPYEYMDSMEKFDDDQLPPKEAFFSKLHNQDITDEEYAHAQNVWRTFNIHNMREYHDLYLKSMASPYLSLSTYVLIPHISCVSLFPHIRVSSLFEISKSFIAADVMILADLFETFRDVSLTKEKFEIDPPPIT